MVAINVCLLYSTMYKQLKRTEIYEELIRFLAGS